MVLFSDADIDEAWELVQSVRELTDEQKLDFIKGFEEGWKLLKKFKHLFPEKAYFDGGIANHLKDGIRENSKDFGKALGAFIGAIRFDPERLVYDSSWTEECVRNLDSQYEFSSYISGKIAEWKIQIKEAFAKWYELQKSSRTAHPEFEKLIKRYEELITRI